MPENHGNLFKNIVNWSGAARSVVQQRYFELGPKKLELSYFFPSYAIFFPTVMLFSSSLRKK